MYNYHNNILQILKLIPPVSSHFLMWLQGNFISYMSLDVRSQCIPSGQCGSRQRMGRREIDICHLSIPFTKTHVFLSLL